jgi:hypothetical protein
MNKLELKYNSDYNAFDVYEINGEKCKTVNNKSNITLFFKWDLNTNDSNLTYPNIIDWKDLNDDIGILSIEVPDSTIELLHNTYYITIKPKHIGSEYIGSTDKGDKVKHYYEYKFKYKGRWRTKKLTRTRIELDVMGKIMDDINMILEEDLNFKYKVTNDFAWEKLEKLMNHKKLRNLVAYRSRENKLNRILKEV